MADLAIETNKLRKEYGAKVAVADLTLEVTRGEIFGFLGPNGAGKSTCVKMLLGLVHPTAGSALVLGHPLGHIPALAHIGFLPEHFRFHEWLTAREFLALHGRLARMDSDTCHARIAEALEMVGLIEHANHQLSSFSKGMLQRIGIAQALLHTPDLVFFDEPTSALDPFGRRLVRTILQQVKAQGATVFLNSHLLSEVEVTCDRVAFIKGGVVLHTLGLHELSGSQMRLIIRVDQVTPRLLERLAALSTEWRFLENREDGTPTLKADASRDETGWPTRIELVTSEAQLPVIANEIVAVGARLYEFTPQRPSLEQLFLDIVGSEDSGQ